MYNVLVVDDSRTALQYVQECLSNAGYSVTTCSDASEALTVARNTQFDCVLTDFHMPKYDGAFLIRALRNKSNYQQTPMLLITSRLSKEERSTFQDIATNGWISKPFDATRLLTAVDEVITEYRCA